MESYKQEFIKFMVESDVLKFGEFTLKSGSMIHTEMILMCCSDRHIKVFHLEL